jgi:hypothetical protein
MTARRMRGAPVRVEHLDEHAFGLELELTELTEQWHRAATQLRTSDAGRLAAELGRVRDELVLTADRAVELAQTRHQPVIKAERARPAA